MTNDTKVFVILQSNWCCLTMTKVNKCDKTLNLSSRWYLHLDMSLISKNLIRKAGKHLLGTWLRDPGPGKKTWFIVFFPSLYTSSIPFLFFWSLMKTAKSFFSFFEGLLSQVHNSHDPGEHSWTAQNGSVNKKVK